MSDSTRKSIRVLIADDETAIQAAYRKVLTDVQLSAVQAEKRDLRARLFEKRKTDAAVPANAAVAATFELTSCSSAELAVAAARQAIAAGAPFGVVFLDMRMPPGADGAWAAEQIRGIDPDAQIVLCTAYSDVDPAEIGRRVPPEDKLFYLSKPFHPHEVRQMALALGRRC